MHGKSSTQREWEEYVSKELDAVAPTLKGFGFELDERQPHIGGERYLMQAVTTKSGKKLTLLGHRTEDRKRVVIKATRDKEGIREIGHERICREALKKIRFAYQTFFSPEELLFTKKNRFVISIQEFLEPKQPFLSRLTKEQFSLALKAFKAQESAHATTYKHRRFIEKTFGEKDANDYLYTFTSFRSAVSKLLPEKKKLEQLLERVESLLKDNAVTIERYSGFLTHTDFVPHNFRVIGNNIYLLDHSSIRFGNKHEGRARFINFMELHNPELARAFVQYVRDNRSEEENLSLKLMRLYRLGEIIFYYTNTLSKSFGELLILNQARIEFWTYVLEAVLSDRPVSESIVEEYKKTRDLLRSEEEKERQVGLH